MRGFVCLVSRLIPWCGTIKPLKMCRLLLVLFEEICGFVQDAAILWDEKVSVSLMNLQLLPIRGEKTGGSTS